jgi:hypothetical protein
LVRRLRNFTNRPRSTRENAEAEDNCRQAQAGTVVGNPDKMNIAFRAGTGGLHSAEN